MFYSIERRPTLKKEKPGLAFGPLSKAIAEEWKNMSKSKKKRFQDKADEDRARYKKEMESYVPSPSDKKAKKKKGKKKDPNAPKRPKSSYMFFANSRRPELKAAHPDWPFGQFGKAIGEEWRAMSESKKDKFEQMAKKDRARYAREMEKYKA